MTTATRGDARFQAVLGSRGVANPTPDELAAAAERDRVDTRVDTFLREHRDHGHRYFYRQLVAHGDDSGSLTCMGCEQSVQGSDQDLNDAVARATATIVSAGPDRVGRLPRHRQR